jgi:glycosyltransferase involved in cell wall biosynthesis
LRLKQELLSDKLRVLMVTTSFPVGANRASGIFVKRLADRLGEEVYLKVIAPSSNSLCDISYSYPVYFFRYAPRKWQKLAHQPGGVMVALKTSPWLFLLLPAFVLMMFFCVIKEGRKIDVIHANWSITGLVAGFAGFCISKPVITTLRGSDVRNVGQSIFSRFVIRQVFRLNKFVVTVSNAIKSDLCELMPNRISRLCCIPNGVSDELLSVSRTSFTGSMIITTIGNLIPLKDVGTIIRAFSKLDSDLRLRIIGDGIERSELEDLCQSLGCKGRVDFLGVIEPGGIRRELEMANIFVLASHSEGKPNVVLEAMAAGCAVVSTDLPGVREVLEAGVSGCVFSPGDVDALTDHLSVLISSKSKRERLGVNARNRIKSMGLTWQKCADSYLELYYRAVGSK